MEAGLRLSTGPGQSYIVISSEYGIPGLTSTFDLGLMVPYFMQSDYGEVHGRSDVDLATSPSGGSSMIEASAGVQGQASSREISYDIKPD